MLGPGYAGIARHRGVPLLVATLAAALSFGTWAYLVQSRREQIMLSTRQIASQSRLTLATTVRNRVETLRNLAGFWATVGQRPVTEWRADADLLIGNYPSFSYIAWIYPDGRRHRVAAGRDGTPGTVEIEPGKARRLGTIAQIVGPERGAAGEVGMRVFLPVRSGELDLGVLEAHIDLGMLLADTLRESSPGYAIRLVWDGQEIFRRDEATTDSWQGWWRTEGSVPIPFDTTWTMTHAPTDALAAAWLTPLPHYLLAVGLLLAFALGLLAHFLRLSALHANFLSAGNEALEASAGQLRRLNATLEARVSERTHELEAFNHSISHDLKSPLGAILNFAAIFESDYGDRLDDDGREILTRIRKSAMRGTELLEGLLRLSRAGHSALRSEEIDMDRLAKESFAQARLSDDTPGVEVAFVANPLPAARGDRTLVGEVLVNLFDNALKYSSDREKRRIEIRGRIEDGQGVYEVSDNGEGFDMRYADKLFGLFERLHTSREIRGTGVGLALVERIVRRHGGKVRAEAKLGEGARFTFTLPRAGSSP